LFASKLAKFGFNPSNIPPQLLAVKTQVTPWLSRPWLWFAADEQMGTRFMNAARPCLHPDDLKCLFATAEQGE